jgi:DNA phosphorothioation-dependent restriction protein DptG
VDFFIADWERAQAMKRSDAEFHLRDVRQMSDRLMIDLFKRKINDMNRSPRHLKGTWHEADDLLQTHFGKISRIMNQNKKNLLKLYQTAIKEMEQSPV